MATAFGADDPFVIEQRRAQENLQQAQESKQYRPPKGPGMVSGIYVKTHPLQYLAEMLRSYTGGQREREAQAQLEDIGTRRNKAITDTTSAYVDALRGSPEQRTAMQADYFDEADRASLGDSANLTAVTPERKADPAKANQILMSSQFPAFQQMGFTNMMETQRKMAEQAQAQAQNQKYMGILSSVENPQDAIRAGVPTNVVKDYYEARNFNRDKVQYKDVGGQLVPVTEYGDRPTNVAPLDKTGNPFSDLVVRDTAGNIVPNAPLVGVKGTIAEKGAPKVDARTYNTQETEQSKTYGKTLGEIRGKITQAGFDAPKQLAKLDRMEQLLQGVDGGAAAPTIAQVSSLANSFGIKLDKNLGPKEAAIALAINMASGLREPGTGPMTDKDFDNFLKQVPDLSKSAAGRQAIMTTLRASIQRDLEAAKFSRDYAKQNNGVIDDNFFDAMANFYAQNPVVNIPMPETNSRGGQFRVVR